MSSARDDQSIGMSMGSQFNAKEHQKRTGAAVKGFDDLSTRVEVEQDLATLVTQARKGPVGQDNTEGPSKSDGNGGTTGTKKEGNSSVRTWQRAIDKRPTGQAPVGSREVAALVNTPS